MQITFILLITPLYCLLYPKFLTVIKFNWLFLLKTWQTNSILFILPTKTKVQFFLNERIVVLEGKYIYRHLFLSSHFSSPLKLISFEDITCYVCKQFQYFNQKIGINIKNKSHKNIPTCQRYIIPHMEKAHPAGVMSVSNSPDTSEMEVKLKPVKIFYKMYILYKHKNVYYICLS